MGSDWFGWTGRALYVDLSKGKAVKKELRRDFIIDCFNKKVLVFRSEERRGGEVGEG